MAYLLCIPFFNTEAIHGLFRTLPRRGFATIRWNFTELTIFLVQIVALSKTMKGKEHTRKQVQAVRCPSCGAGPGSKANSHSQEGSRY